MMKSHFSCRLLVNALSLAAVSMVSLALAGPAMAQGLSQASAGEGDTVFDGDWLSVGVGVGVGPSYDGSDDYTVFPVPLVQGNIAGIAINPRPAGLAFDFVPNPDEGIGLNLGANVRMRSNRAIAIKDPVVASLGKLDRALEVGPTIGFTLPKILHDYDSLSVNLDLRWDVTGVHGGMLANPSITYFTPLSRGSAVSFTLDAERGDDQFMDYYYSISPDQSVASGLSSFTAHGGWTRASALAIGGLDFSGDLTDGGLALFVLGGYTHMLDDAAASPVTSERGSPNQWLGALGLGYTF